MNQRIKTILFIVVSLAVIVLLYVVDFKKKTSGQDEERQVYVDLPDADIREVSDSKSHAYSTFTDKEKSQDIEDYWDLCDEEISRKESEKKEVSGSADLFGSSSSAPSSATVQPTSGRQTAAYSNPYRETAQEREQRHQRRREEAIEMAERMRDGEKDTQEEGEQVPETVSLPSHEVSRTSIISVSDDGWGADISSLGDEPELEQGDDRPLRCMFSRQEKIRDGQRVAVILLEEICINGTVIPKNTHLMGTCQLSSRLEVRFESIEMGGRILPLGYEAYDTDGSRGIYCPDVGSTGRSARERGTDIARSTLSSRLGRVAQDVVSTGVSLARASNGETTVTVPSGYSFFIVKRKDL